TPVAAASRSRAQSPRRVPEHRRLMTAKGWPDLARDDAIDDRAQPQTASEQEAAAPAGRKTRRLDGVRIFSSASDAPRSRRPTDGIMLALAVLGGVILSYSAPGPTAFDTAATDLVAQLPDLAGWFWEVTYDLLIIWSLCLLLLSLFTPGRKLLFLYEGVAVALEVSDSATRRSVRTLTIGLRVPSDRPLRRSPADPGERRVRAAAA